MRQDMVRHEIATAEGKGGHVKIIGLTGGIASGKSTVSALLKELGAYIVDADRIAREIVTPGSEALKEIAGFFGEEILNGDGTLKRAELARRVFNDPAALEKLNQITHPRIISAIEERIRQAAPTESVLVLDAALLLELNLKSLVDEIWLVCVAPETQFERLLKREAMTREDAGKIIRTQLPLEAKMAAADVCIDNNGTVEALRQKIQKLWNEQVKA